jgi:hypothetical protein
MAALTQNRSGKEDTIICMQVCMAIDLPARLDSRSVANEPSGYTVSDLSK